MGKRLTKPPKIFRVNWFRRGRDGKFLWPGFGENLRVIRWALDRCAGRAKAVDSPIGYLPTPDAIDTKGLDLPADTMKELLTVNTTEWADALKGQSEYFAQFGDRLPRGIKEEHDNLASRLRTADHAHKH
jgi:phosphoenolpyruvate carboxykinase (GTP)